MIRITKTIPKLRRLLTCGLATLALLMFTQQAHAEGNWPGDFLGEYPQAGPALTAAANNCSLCHTNISNSNARNAYGADIQPANDGTIVARLRAVELLNSDGDTANGNACDNITEINADTLPGDANSTPASCGDVPPPNVPPVADANGPYNGTAGLQLTFDGSGSSDSDGTIVAFNWSFGDGNTGTGVSPVHTYAAAGIFTVTLTVTDDAGDTDSATSAATIVVAPQDPIADPNGPYNGTVGIALTLDGSGSLDPDGGVITAYDWDFGDGNTGTGVSPSHIYTTADSFTVTLTVVDDEGAQSAAATTAATISPPANELPVSDPNGPYNGTAGQAVNFDGSGSSDPDGTIVAYGWDFGDGNTGTGVAPTHSYAAAGNYSVSLTVTDDAGSIDTATTSASIVAAPADPIADPNGPYSGFEGQPVSFDGSGSFDPDGGDITAYDWDFGDGNTGTGVAPGHTYAAAGAYTVTLSVVDDEGAQSVPATTTATVSLAPANLPPVSDPNGPYTGTTGQPVSFDGSGSNDPDGAIVAYDWDFGDGSSGAGVSPSHTYASAGTYTVTLGVTDDAGATDAASTTATLSDAPVLDCEGITVKAEWRSSGESNRHRRSRRGDDDHDDDDDEHDNEHDNDNDGVLIVTGRGERDGRFILSNAFDPDQVIASRRGRTGRFFFRIDGEKLNPVPCRVQVDQPDIQLCGQADVKNAPDNCAP